MFTPTTNVDSRPAPTPLESQRSSLQGILLSAFDPIELPEMNHVALLNRFETKYVMHMNTLVEILALLREAYSALVIEGRHLNRYRTLYFDTGNFALYHRHHMGARNRYKIRAREYVESQAWFLEIKHKTNKNRTIKHRMLTPELRAAFEEDSAQFLRDRYPHDIQELVPRLWNHYTRITLVNKSRSERVTLDFDLQFKWDEQQTSLPGIVIAEVKRQGRAYTSDFTTLMREQHIRTNSFSKYCVGVSLLYPEIKQNKFKATHRLIAKLSSKPNSGARDDAD